METLDFAIIDTGEIIGEVGFQARTLDLGIRQHHGLNLESCPIPSEEKDMIGAD